MVPLEILPMVPLMANGTIGNQRTLNVSRQPMVPLVPMLPLVKTLVPMVPLTVPMVPLVSPMVSKVIIIIGYSTVFCKIRDFICTSLRSTEIV